LGADLPPSARDPPILILDEAIAMFDPEGEARFIEDCRATIGSKTVLSLPSAICESSGSRTPMPSSH